MKKIKLYTDGACSRNPGPGGWGCVLLYTNPNGEVYRKELNDFVRDTTNQQMELTAAVRGLQELSEPCEVTVYSDSAYFIDNAQPSTGRVYNWRSNGWTLQNGSEPKNVDLWKEFVTVAAKHKYTLVKVAAHSDDVENNRCDVLAKKGYLEYEKKKKEEAIKRLERKQNKLGIETGSDPK